MIYVGLILVVLFAISIPIIQSQYIYPSFIDQLIRNTEEEAVRAGKHIQKEVLEYQSDNQLKISKPLLMYMDSTVRDFDLWKIKLFTANGETIYSTSEKDIGVINKHSYFRNIVSKGRTYTKMVRENTRTLDGDVVEQDVIEIYIPIMSKDIFLGAFELYYNVTIRRESMDALISKLNVILNILTVIVILSVLTAAFIYRNGMKERQRYENALLDIATRDKLTGLFNRHGFENLFSKEYERCVRYKQSACIILFDIDYFKQVNDTYGHQAGDQVLSVMAQECKAALRKSDIIGRYGGEEFIVFLPESNCDGAMNVAEKLRKSIESCDITTSGGDVRVTISIGVSCFDSNVDTSSEQLIKKADTALYSAKENGRNQVRYES